MKILALLVVVCSLALSRCQDQQLQCSELDVEHTGPPQSGSDLSLCDSDGLQCCLQSHIDAVTDVARNRLSLGLRLQMRETSLKFNATIDGIKSYFANEAAFFTSFVASLPTLNGLASFEDLSNIARPVIQTFIQNIQTANVTQIVRMVSASLAAGAGQAVGGGNPDTITCVRDTILRNVNETDITILIQALTNVQKAVKSLDGLTDFLYRYRMNTEFTFPRNCVRRFVELNFCARCTRRTPPLCSNTCGALFRGCLSPYYNVLNRQFDLVWNISRQVLRQTNNSLHMLFSEERNIINVGQIISELSSCNIMFPGPGKRKRHVGDPRVMFIPQDRMMELRDLSGKGVSYDDADGRGPLICRASERERQFCSNRTQRGEGDYCSSRMDCTSECRCYDGMRDRMDNSEEFNVNDIEGQDENPVIDLTNSELTSIVEDIGMPARAFLVEQSAAFPDGVTIPPSPTTDGAPTIAATSTMVLLLAAIVTFFFQ